MKKRSEFSLSLLVGEHDGMARSNEPGTVGVPFPKGVASDPSCLVLCGPHDQPIPLQVQVLARWSDGSVKWALLDFQASVEASSPVVYKLHPLSEVTTNFGGLSLTLQEKTDYIIVDTSAAIFVLNRQFCKLFDGVLVQGTDLI